MRRLQSHGWKGVNKMEGIKKKSYYHWVILISCVLVLMFSYSTRFACATLFTAPILEELGFARSAYFLGSTIACLVCMVTSPIVGRLMRGKYMHITFVICSIGVALFYPCAGLCHTLPQFYLVSFLQGFFAMGACTIPTTTLITNWFEKHRGLAISIVMSGISIGGTVLSPIVSYLINTQGWRKAYFWLGVMMMCVLAPISIFIVRRTPEEMGLLPYGHGEIQENSKKNKVNSVNSWNADLKTLKKTGFFWVFIFGATAISIVSCMLGHIPVYVQGTGYNAAVATSVISLISFIGIFGKLILGHIFDRFGSKAGIICGNFAFLLSLVCLLFITNKFVLYSASALYGFGNCVATIAIPILITSSFGAKYYSEIYGFVSIFTMFGGAFGSPLIGLCYDLTGSYIFALLLLIGLAILMTGALLYSIRAGEKRQRSKTS